MTSALRRKNIKKGLQFTIMLVGSSGLGKSSFINTLCDDVIIQPRTESASDSPHITFETFATELEEDGIKISLSVVNTPGFGDAINNEASCQTLLQYIEQQYDDVLMEETRIKRNPRLRDNRVHVLLYFIKPTGHSLKKLDIETMKSLSARVNIIPVISRADALTPDEVAAFKTRIMEDIQFHNIPLFTFPNDKEDDAEISRENEQLRSNLPFALIGAEEVGTDGTKRGRTYPWGVAECFNPQHSDLKLLRHALFGSHLTELRYRTEDVLYEQYRTERLSNADGGISAQDESRYTNLGSDSMQNSRRSISGK